MSDRELLVTALCLMPLVTALVSIFACELRISERENNTRRFPRYGKSGQMRTKGKSRIKKLDDDNET